MMILSAVCEEAKECIILIFIRSDQTNAFCVLLLHVRIPKDKGLFHTVEALIELRLQY